ncbi:serine aminopeptidase domain-containing protein [Algihabitans albus]|uniref:serine aminopeptidase domain-containing protein n=1 Tax=Algihabitans albus TaxID=2164067 RepID=UPI000E5DA466|nr:alpha/beta hydrolase [Algihabitans albus]
MLLTWASQTAFGKRALPCLALLAFMVAASGSSLAQSNLARVPGGSGAWLAPTPALTGDNPLALADPQGTAVLIFLPGSSTEGRPDICRPLDSRLGTTPQAFQRLAGRTLAGKTLAVFGFCSETKLGSFRKDRYAGEPKVIGRKNDLRTLVEALRAAGLPAEQLFLAGHSAGGWAALLLQRDRPFEINAVLAFAPAFTGPRATRTESWSRLRREMITRLSEAERLQALVVAVQGDPYNRPQDLAFLAQIPGVRLIGLSSDELEGRPCEAGSPHQLIYRDCFSDTQVDRIAAYLEQSLQGSDQRGPQNR